MKLFVLSIAVSLALIGCTNSKTETIVSEKELEVSEKRTEVTIFDGEKHFKNIRQLTFGGENAEAYFSYNADKLIFQSKRDGLECDAIFTMNVDGSNVTMVSSSKGATTCSFIAPDDKSIIYASTHLSGNECPPKPDMSRGYVWALYKSFDIFKADPDGS
ncbi:MAG: TolB family protein, partial [Candidatus Scalindua sp.]